MKLVVLQVVEDFVRFLELVPIWQKFLHAFFLFLILFLT